MSLEELEGLEGLEKLEELEKLESLALRGTEPLVASIKGSATLLTSNVYKGSATL